jgi:hypothetical protein
MEQVADWNEDKNEMLIARFGFGFERVLASIREGGLLDERTHPNSERYGHQFQLIVQIDNYAWVVPYVVNGDRTFFKTLFPSRVETKNYMGIRQ